MPGSSRGDDDGEGPLSSSSSSEYDPEYETEEVAVNRDVTLNVLTVVPPPLEFLARLRRERREISGRKVWSGSLLLAQFLCHQLAVGRNLKLDDQRILELGSGTGLLGMSLCKVTSNASCIALSDGDTKAVDLLRQNLSHNGMVDDNASVGALRAAPTILAEQLLWGDTGSLDRFSDCCRTLLCRCWEADEAVFFDCVVAGDVLYKVGLPAVFFQTVLRFLAKNGVLWLCHVPRANVTHEIVVQSAHAAGLRVVERVRPCDDGVMDFVGEGCPRDELERAVIYRMVRGSN